MSTLESSPATAGSSVARLPARRRLAFALITLAVIGLASEAASRVALYIIDEVRIPTNKDYVVPDPAKRGLWRLKPGFRQTWDQVFASQRTSGRVLALAHYQASVDRLKIPHDSVGIQVNAAGYRGPELAADFHGVRILTIGDSCTFGTIEPYIYPRALEIELRSRGHQVEVVNAGVEGYSPKHALARADEFVALRPDIAVVYIGWNALFKEWHVAAGPADALASVRLAKRLLARVWQPGSATKVAWSQYNKQKHPDLNDPLLAALDDYRPSFLGDVEQLVSRLKQAGIEVVLCTLPGLYDMDQQPTDKALEFGHLPEFTSNPYVLAKMAARYNAAIGQLAERHRATVVDLAGWRRQRLEPADQYFFDSVHLWEEGQQQIGRYLAGQLEPQVRGHQNARRSSATTSTRQQ